MSLKEEQKVANNIVIEGQYRLVDSTPDAPWDNQDKVRFYKKNAAAALILFLAVMGLVFVSGNKEVQILSLTLSGSAASVLLNGEQKNQQKK